MKVYERNTISCSNFHLHRRNDYDHSSKNETSKKKNMKNLIMILLMVVTVLTSCSKGGDSNGVPSTPEELMAKKIEAINWKIVTVSVDGVDYTTLFKNFTMKLGDQTYSTTNSPSDIWKSSGTWKFISNTNGYQVMRDDGVEIDISQIDENSLVFSMMWNKTTYGGGRTSSVSGKHTFTMSK